MLVGLVVFLLVDVAAYYAGRALHPAHAALQGCPLVTVGQQAGHYLVSYADDTGDARMSAAIRSAVADWNGLPTDVRLVPGAATAALTFRAGVADTPVPACPTPHPRTVVITFGSRPWDHPEAANGVRQPEAAVSKVIGRALGLHAQGSCPDLLAQRHCGHRDVRPDGKEMTALDQLYRAEAALSPSPSPTRS